MAPSAQHSICVPFDLDKNELTNESKPFRRINQRLLKRLNWKSSENITKASAHNIIPVDGEESFKCEWILYSILGDDILNEYESITLIAYMNKMNIPEQLMLFFERLQKHISHYLRSVDIENFSFLRVGSISQNIYGIRIWSHTSGIFVQYTYPHWSPVIGYSIREVSFVLDNRILEALDVICSKENSNLKLLKKCEINQNDNLALQITETDFDSCSDSSGYISDEAIETDEADEGPRPPESEKSNALSPRVSDVGDQCPYQNCDDLQSRHHDKFIVYDVRSLIIQKLSDKPIENSYLFANSHGCHARYRGLHGNLHSINHGTPLGLHHESDSISRDNISRNDLQLHEETDPLANIVESDHHDTFSGQYVENSTACEELKVPDIDNSVTGSNAAARIDFFPNAFGDREDPDGDWKASNNHNELLHNDTYDENNIIKDAETVDHAFNAHQSGDAGHIGGQRCPSESAEVFVRDSELHRFGDENSIHHDSPLPDGYELASGDHFSRCDLQLREETDPLVDSIESDHHDTFPGQALENSRPIASEQSKVPIENSEKGSNAAATIGYFPNTSRDDQERDGEWKAPDNPYEFLHRDLYDEESVLENVDHPVNAHQYGDAGDIVGQRWLPVSREVFARDSELHRFGDENSIQHDSPLPDESEDSSRYFSRYDLQLHEETDAVSENDSENFDHPLNVHQSDDAGHIRRQQWPPASAETTWLSEAGRFWSTQYRPVTLIRRDITPLPDVEINALAYTDSSDVSSVDSLSPSRSPTGFTGEICENAEKFNTELEANTHTEDSADILYVSGSSASIVSSSNITPVSRQTDENVISSSNSNSSSHQSDTAAVSHLLYTQNSEEQRISEQACVTGHPSQLSSKRHENFTMEECRTMQRKILGNSRINNVIAGVSFGSNQITIEYVSNPTFDTASFKAMLLEILKLDEEQINLIEWTTDRCVRRTSVTPASDLAHTSCTKIGAAVCISNLNGHFAIVCGHDKSERSPVERIAEGDPNARRTLGVVEYSLFRDNDKTEESMDVALVNLSTRDSAVKPYINCSIDIPNEGRRNVRVYIRDTFDVITNRATIQNMRVQTYSVNPVQGVITGYPVAVNVLPLQNRYERPLYNGIQIQSPDLRRAIHKAGDSGMLVTTTVNIDDITRDPTRNDYYTAPVYVVGMLVAANSRYSLALPMCQTINDLLGYMNHPDQVTVQGGRRPASITFDNPLTVRISGALRASVPRSTNSLRLNLCASVN